MDLSIRSITPPELSDFLDHVEAAFGHRAQAERVEELRHIVACDRALVAETDDGIVGTAAVYPFRLSVPGGELPAGGVTMVGVLPSHRRRGVLRSLMTHQLASDLPGAGEPLAVLWASEGSIYGRFGYGLAAFALRMSALRHRVRFLSDPPNGFTARLVDTDGALGPLSQVYDRVRARTPGFPARDRSWLRYHTLSERGEDGSGDPLFRVVIERDGNPAAYALYRMHGKWDDAGPAWKLDVHEAVADGPEAERALWGYLFGVDLVIELSSYHLAPEPPLVHMVTDVRHLRLGLDHGLWLRVVDLPRALSGRAYARAGELVMRVHDDLLPANDGTWVLRAADGDASCERTGAAPEIEWGIAELGACYLGGIGPRALAAAGRVHELAPGAVERAEALLRWPVTAWCPEVF